MNGYAPLPSDPVNQLARMHHNFPPGSWLEFDVMWGWGRLYTDALMVRGKTLPCYVFMPNSSVEIARASRIAGTGLDS